MGEMVLGHGKRSGISFRTGPRLVEKEVGYKVGLAKEEGKIIGFQVRKDGKPISIIFPTATKAYIFISEQRRKECTST